MHGIRRTPRGGSAQKAPDCRGFLPATRRAGAIFLKSSARTRRDSVDFCQILVGATRPSVGGVVDSSSIKISVPRWRVAAGGGCANSGRAVHDACPFSPDGENY